MFVEDHIIVSVLKAYENEIEIDKSIKRAFNIEQKLPNYRVLKLLSIRNRIGLLFVIFKPTFMVFVFFSQIIHMLRALLSLCT